MNMWEYLDRRARHHVNLDVLIGRTQRNTTYLYAFLVISSILFLIFLPNPSEVAKTILVSIANVFGTVIVMQNTFWFGRPRGAGVPDPTAPGTTTDLSIRQVTPPAATAVSTVDSGSAVPSDADSGGK